MNVIKEEGSRPIKIWTEDIEDGALQQLRNLAKLSFIAPNGVAAMPDVHYGIGATIGSVIATQGAIIPAAVGVDIGCGMYAIMLSLRASDLPDSLAEIRHSIERGVPLGPGGRFQPSSLDRGRDEAWGYMSHEYEALAEAHPAVVTKSCPSLQLGTLGSGNHFIEVCIDENQHVWVMLHSGSRGIGNRIGTHFIALAKKDMEKYFISLPDADLAYVVEGTDHFRDYVQAVTWAQNYARTNRFLMMQEILRRLHHHIEKPFTSDEEVVDCHHNYISQEHHFGTNYYVTRKGAIRARTDDLGIIPGSMGQRSYIVRGLGNAESYTSCSHGAGRKMGRNAARKQFTVSDLAAQTAGVECRKDEAVLDEIPACYKDLDVVMANQKDLVEIVHTLKAVLCVKGA